MDSQIPAILFGALLLIVGITMLIYQRRARAEADNSLTNEERRFLRRRIQRRNQVAGMILIIGVMIPVGDSLIDWRHAPGTFAIYWVVVIGLAIWSGLLGIADMAATRAHMARELNRLHRSKLEIHRLAQQARKPDPNGPSDI